MIPCSFPQTNVEFAKDQPEYQALPACVTEDGMVISCWQLSPAEIAEVQRTGVIWLKQLTFFQKLQPQLPQVENPFEVEKQT